MMLGWGDLWNWVVADEEGYREIDLGHRFRYHLLRQLQAHIDFDAFVIDGNIELRRLNRER